MLFSEVAAEALFGVATALGVSPDEIRAPRLRFDALGSYVGSDARVRHRVTSDASRTLFVGTTRPDGLALAEQNMFLAFTGGVAREGVAQSGAGIASFHDLASLLLR